MFLVGGGILVHGIPLVHHGIEHLLQPWGAWGSLALVIFNGIFGIIAGALALMALKMFKSLRHNQEKN